MDISDREILFNRIVSGTTIVEDLGYFINDPSPIEFSIGYNYYQKTAKELELKNVPTENEATALLIEKKLWSESDEKQLVELQENLVKLKKQLPSLEFKSNEKKEVLAYIEHTRNLIDRLNHRKNSLLTNTVEYIAKLAMYKKYLFLLTFNENGDRVWKSWDSFLKEDDKLLNRLINLAFFNPEIDQAKIRDLARNEPWRSLWVASNKIGDLFGKPLIHLTNYQRVLVIWSVLYDNAYESTECPAQEVFDNDDLFDAWLEEQSLKRKNEKNNSGHKINGRAANAQEVGVVVDTADDAKKVYNLNDSASLSTLKNRQNVLQSGKTVAETELPDVKKRMSMIKNNLERDKILRGSNG